MGNVATRLLSLIMMLQSRPSWKAAEIASELNVSERTVHRYMGMLDEIGIPIYSERGRYGGFSLVRGYRLPPLIFTAEEATVLYMGANLVREVWGQTYDDAATAVTAKLDNVLPDDLRQEVAYAQRTLVVSGLTAQDDRPWEPTLHTLRKCIGERKSVRLVYHSPAREKETDRVVEPYALAFQWGQWYLAGFCRLRDSMRTFRVDRIRRIEPLADRFSPPDDFSVREHLARSMNDEAPHRVRVRLTGRAAQNVREWRQHWLDVTEEEGGAVVVQFGATSLDWATGWVLGFGAAALALDPPELVERVRAAAQEILRGYSSGKVTTINRLRTLP